MKTRSHFLLATNAARRAGNILIGLAANVDAPAITDDQNGWVELAPYGDTVYWNQEDGEWRKYTQSFQKPQGEAMAAAFNSLSVKKGSRFKGLPIYSGHPDADPRRWPDERRLGGIMGMEAREDGLYVKPAWNSLGEENRKEGFLVYPSPAWLYDQRKAQASGVIQPTELRSVGLTNTPRIQDVLPWVNSDDPDAPENPAVTQSQSDSNHPTDPATSKKMNFKKMLAEHLGVSADSSDDDLQKAHDAVMGSKKDKDAADAKAHSDKAAADAKVKEMQASVSNAETARDTAKADADKFRGLAANALLDTAVGAGRINAAERDTFATAFNADFDGASARLAEKQPALNTRTLGLTKGSVGVDLANPESRRLAFNARVDHLIRENGKPGKRYGIDQALADMRANPDDAALLKAMEPVAA